MFQTVKSPRVPPLEVGAIYLVAPRDPNEDLVLLGQSPNTPLSSSPALIFLNSLPQVVPLADPHHPYALLSAPPLEYSIHQSLF
ncbi:MAG: hypothetical protein BWY29_00729 [Microgenomates group bacterium ADurb.Bin238]|nr:MAG: hypothetical protein BWY29_00729 [Microgenomates group bacterium ADurb.Bin238]